MSIPAIELGGYYSNKDVYFGTVHLKNIKADGSVISDTIDANLMLTNKTINLVDKNGLSVFSVDHYILDPDYILYSLTYGSIGQPIIYTGYFYDYSIDIDKNCVINPKEYLDIDFTDGTAISTIRITHKNQPRKTLAEYIQGIVGGGDPGEWSRDPEVDSLVCTGSIGCNLLEAEKVVTSVLCSNDDDGILMIDDDTTLVAEKDAFFKESLYVDTIISNTVVEEEHTPVKIDKIETNEISLVPGQPGISTIALKNGVTCSDEESYNTLPIIQTGSIYAFPNTENSVLNVYAKTVFNAQTALMGAMTYVKKIKVAEVVQTNDFNDDNDDDDDDEGSNSDPEISDGSIYVENNVTCTDLLVAKNGDDTGDAIIENMLTTSKAQIASSDGRFEAPNEGCLNVDEKIKCHDLEVTGTVTLTNPPTFGNDVTVGGVLTVNGGAPSSPSEEPTDAIVVENGNIDCANLISANNLSAASTVTATNGVLTNALTVGTVNAKNVNVLVDENSNDPTGNLTVEGTMTTKDLVVTNSISIPDRKSVV